MQSKTSFSDTSLFRRCLKRYWPLTFVMLVLLILFVVIPAANAANSLVHGGSSGDTPARTMLMRLVASTRSSVFTAFVFALGTAMCMFEHTYSAKLTGLFASLPVRREKLFWQHWLAGLWMLWSVGIVTALAVMIVTLSQGALSMTGALSWLGMWLLNTLTFYGIAVFCVMLTGHVLVIPALYALINFAASALSMLLSGLVSTYGFGVTGEAEGLLWMHSCSPPVKLLIEIGERYDAASRVVGVRGWGWAIGYAVVGLILTICALLLFRARHSECAQETTAFPVLKPILKYIVTAFFALGFPFVVFFFLGDFSLYGGRITAVKYFPLHLVLSLVGAVIGYFLSEMIIRKSVRAYSGWGLVKALIVGLLACALVCAFRYDAFGISSRIPAAQKIEMLQIEVGGQTYMLRDEAEIDAGRALHKTIVENRDEAERNTDSETRGRFLHLIYHLKDGTAFTRGYSLPEGALLDRVEALLNTEPIRGANLLLDPPVPVDETHILECYVGCGERSSRTLTIDEALSLWNEGILPDCEEGHYGDLDMLYDDDEYARTHYDAGISFSLQRDGDSGVTLDFEPTIDTVHTNAWLEAHGFPLTLLADAYGG